MAIRKRVRGGFTLIELMIVVAIVGVLAVLAVYGVRKYIANAKTAEAKNSLGQIGKDAASAYEGERMTSGVLTEGTTSSIIRQMCASASQPVPNGAGNVRGAKYQSTKGDWSNGADVNTNAGFPCLRFEMTAPQYYMYGYTAANVTAGDFTATANGDLNGDDILSTFTMLGSINGSGRLNLAPSIGEVSPEE